MEPNAIIEKYLPMLQDLQAKAATKKGVCFDVYVNSENQMLAQITLKDGNPDHNVAEYFHTGYSEKDMDEKVLTLYALFAEFCTASITGIDFHICNN